MPRRTKLHPRKGWKNDCRSWRRTFSTLPGPLKILQLHSWRVKTRQAKVLQEELRNNISSRATRVPFNSITGADISYPRFSACTVTGIMVLARPDMEVVETRTTSGRMTFPYAPGYRSFREVPLLIRAFRRLRSQLSAFDVRRPGYGTSQKFRLGVSYGAAEGPSFDRLRKIGSVREKFGACIGG